MKIAIIGSGISGLSAAYILNKHYDIKLYEKNNYLGGHSRTVNINIDDKNIPVDTGFIVFNYRNYPNLTSLFKLLDVPVEKSNMSFGVSIEDGKLEYGTNNLFSMFAQTKNLFKIKFWQMLLDILKFNNHAKKYIDLNLTLGQLIKKLNLRSWFRDYYLLAMGGAIWSTPISGMLDFPAHTFIKFFDNHGLLTISDQPQWYTVKGGSKEYVKKITADFKDKIKLNCAVEKVIRKSDYIEIIDAENNVEKYDQVIFACHTNQVLKILENPTKDEKNIIGDIDYQENQMILHSDVSFMQKRKNSWSSWVYLSENMQNKSKNVSLSYWMNNLQPLNIDKPIIVTLNPYRLPKENTIYDKYVFDHPVFNAKAINAQNNIDKIQGVDKIWYVGAWQRYGFHEDGLLSSVNMVKKMGVAIPWI